MTEISEPRTTFTILGANVSVSNAAQRVLVVGQMTAAGTATAGELNTEVEDSAVKTLTGTGGMIADFFDMFRRINTITPIDVIALDDPTGDAAAGAILWDGTATAAGSFDVCCGDERSSLATVTVAIGDTSDDLATATTAAFATLTDSVHTVSTDGSTTDQNNVTYNHDGTEGNSGTIYVDGTVAGITFTITGMTGGTGTPTMTSVLDVIGNQRYQTICLPGSYSTSELVTLMDDRWNVANRILDGVGIVTVADTSANHVTALGSLNSLGLCYQCEDTESTSKYKGASLPENLFSRSAIIAAIRSLRFTDGADISSLVDARGGSDDATGGTALASLPYFNTPASPLPTYRAGFGFTDAQIEAIKTAGGFVIGNNTAGNAVILGEIPTTYKTDAQGTADSSFKYLNYVDTNSAGREYMFNNIKSDCAQDRLTSGDLIANRKYKNEQSIRTLFKQYYGVLSGREYCITVAGEDALNYFETNLSVSVDMETGTVTASMKVPIVVQLRTIVATWQMSFTV